MSATVSTLGDFVKQKQQSSSDPHQSQPHTDDEHEIWAKLLANKVRRMHDVVADQFKLEVDTMALQYMKKKESDI